MAAVDTNVLVRFLVRDDTVQQARAARLLRDCLASGQRLFVPVSVALELEWVLRSNFGFAKSDVVETLTSLMSARELTFESESALEFALAFYRKGSADYSDCVHAALATQAGEAPLWTFDRQASKVAGARLLA